MVHQRGRQRPPFQGMEINVLSETIPTHEYESNTLTKAFEEITGIKVNHQILGEGEVVQAVQTQMQTGRNLYDAYINDSDLIGTHSRLQLAVNLTDWMAGEGKDVTNPGLDLDDFMGKSSSPPGRTASSISCPISNLPTCTGSARTGSTAEDLQAAFKEKYGYDLGVPVNWSAYEDIAEFFTNDVKEIDGTRVYGHMDYGKRAPDLGWRMTDAWLSMAGAGSKGCPMASRSTNGASAWRQARAIPQALRSPAAAAPMARPRSTPSANGTNGCANMPLPALPTMTSTSRCRRSARATSPSRSSGTRPSPPTW
jgi:hypothetical protein